MNASAQLKEKTTILENVRRYAVILTLMTLVLIAVISTRGIYLSPNNLLNVGERGAFIGIVALGQMLVILTGGIDLSVSGIIAIGFCITSLLQDTLTTSIPIPVVILAMLLVTTFCGCINGLLVSKTKVPPFMLTLGTYLIYQSLALVMSSAANVSFENQVRWLTSTFHLEGLSGRLVPTIMWILSSIVIIFVLRSSKFGKNLYATGSSELAAKMSGIKNNRIKFSAYVLSGLMCGIAALAIEFRLVECNPASSATYQIDSIAAVIVGGASLNGGEGNVYGTFVGAFIMATLLNLMNLLSVDVYSQNIFKGAVLIGCIFLTQVLARSNSKNS